MWLRLSEYSLLKSLVPPGMCPMLLPFGSAMFHFLLGYL